jgi:hypothetical protein
MMAAVSLGTSPGAPYLAAGGPGLAASAPPATRTSDPATRRFRRYLVVFVLAGPPLLAWLVDHRPETVTLGQALLAAAVIVLGFVPAMVYLARGARSPLPLLPMSGLFYALTFGLPAFSEDLDWRAVPAGAITTAFVLTLCGLAVMYLAYLLSGQLLFRRLRPIRIPGRLSPSRLRTVAWACFAAHLAYQFAPSWQQVPSIGHFFLPLGWMAIGLLYLGYLQGRLPLAHAVVFFGLAMPLELMGRLASGALYEFFVVVVFLSLIYWQVRRRVPWAVLGVSAVLFVLLNDVKYEYRSRVSLAEFQTTDVWAKVTTLGQVLTDSYGDLQRGPADAAVSSVNRIGHIVMFAYVVETTPDMVPYWGGETYTFLFASVIPRFLWPEKPEAGFGNEFGRRYRFLHPRNFETTINVPWLTEFYMNFGAAGVIAGMALVGIGFRFLVQKLSNPVSSPAEYVLGLSLVFQLFYAESNLALMWGGLLLTFLSLYLTVRVASLRLTE